MTCYRVISNIIQCYYPWAANPNNELNVNNDDFNNDNANNDNGGWPALYIMRFY